MASRLTDADLARMKGHERPDSEGVWRDETGRALSTAYVTHEIAPAIRSDLDLAVAEIRRLRAVLEDIAEGNGGCSSKYGPGCDAGCARTAWAALRAALDDKGADRG